MSSGPPFDGDDEYGSWGEIREEIDDLEDELDSLIDNRNNIRESREGEEEIEYTLFLKNFDMHLSHDREEQPDISYSDLISDADVVSGELHHTMFTLENIGERDYPGGKIENIRSIGEHNSIEYAVILDVPAIDAGEEEEIDLGLSTSNPGHTTYVMDITAKDHKKIEILHEGEDKNVQNTIRFSVRAVDRERLLMLAELRMIRRLLEE